MKTSIDWLNQYLDRPVTREEAIDRLTRSGFPEDGVETYELSKGGTAEAIDFEVTSNRGDCLSHLGLSREIAAATDRTLTPPDLSEPGQTDGKAADLITVDNQATDLCPLYTARAIRGVKVGPSPAWLVERLESIGQRSINNVVDITNFVLHEYGQPLHAFDLVKVGGAKIVVRRAAAGERFTTLDGNAHTLNLDNLVIADANEAVALAGVMGGLDSEVTEATTDVLLEAAIFEPLCVRGTSRKLKLATDSSYRFERGVDATRVADGSLRAALMILELAGGTMAEGVVSGGVETPSPRQVALRPSRCRSLLGLELSDEQIAGYLAALGLSPESSGDTLTCTVPAHRLDLHREVDLIEEVARLHGMDQVPVEDHIELRVRPPQDAVKAEQALHETLVAHGFHEAVTFSFVSEKAGAGFTNGHDPVMIGDERRKAEPMLRPSLVPSLLQSRKANQDVGNHGVHLYEFGSAWRRENGAIAERQTLTLIADADDADAALRSVRGLIIEAVERLGGRPAVDGLRFEPVEDASHQVAADVKLGGEMIGRFGLLNAQAVDAFDLQTPVVAAELDRSALIGLYPPKRSVRALPRFPGIERDVSVIVDESVAWSKIEAAVLSASPALMESLSFVGVYRGKPIAKGAKSVSLRMTFREPDRTLRHDEVDPQVQAVVDRLAADCGATLRA